MAIIQVKAYQEFVELITSHPTVEEIANFHYSDEAQLAIRHLLDANRNQTLTAQEAEELDEYVRLEYIIQQAKIRAYEKLS
ncbi:MAG: hypothetical protein Q9P01_20885 [Anaerolineae bacterium]|nr:hypothetical protein [Anaerolineae bacterium]MDQ7037204.1 hypothetical protein [Anaerolineae bacterium]